MTQLSLHSVDTWIIIGYFILIFAISAILIVRERRAKAEGTNEYFLGGRNAGWFIIGASLFASNIGSEHLVGLAGAGASGEFAAAQIEIIAAFMLLLLGWVFVPFYLRSGVFTMPEFLELRYNSWARGYLSWASVIAYVLTKVSITLVAGGLVLTALLGINFWTGTLIIVAITGLYTILGGLKAVLYTDMVQLFVLLGGSIAVVYFGLEAAGGWGQVMAKTEPSYTSVWRAMSDETFPWTGILIGAPILGVWYWCTDQFIVQRVLAAKNIAVARRGAIFAGFLKLTPMFLFVLPGVLAYVLSQGPNPVLEFPLVNGDPAYDSALPVLVMTVLPEGFRGLVIAGLIAALMSSLSSVFNSCSTLFTMDIYRKYNADATSKELVSVGRVATVVIILLSLAWIPVLQSMDGGLFTKLQSLQAYIAPPIAAVFLMGILTKRVDGRGAKMALIIGSILGLLRLVLESANLSLPRVLGSFTEMNFLHFAIFLFAISTTVLLLFKDRAGLQIEDSSRSSLTLSSIQSIKGTKLNAALSVLLVLSILIIWYAFS